MAIIRAEQQTNFTTGLYPINIPAVNAIGYQLPTVPGGMNIGDLANADLDDAFPGTVVIELIVDTSDKVTLRLSRVPAGYANIELTVKNADGGADFVGTLALVTGTEFSTTIAGLSDYLLLHEKDVVTTLLNFTA